MKSDIKFSCKCSRDPTSSSAADVVRIFLNPIIVYFSRFWILRRTCRYSMIISEICSTYCQFVTYALFYFFTQSQNLQLSTCTCISKQFGKDLLINLKMKIYNL